MESLIILLVIAFFTLPIVALVVARSAKRQSQQLQERLDTLEAELRFQSRQSTPVPAAAAESTSVPAPVAPVPSPTAVESAEWAASNPERRDFSDPRRPQRTEPILPPALPPIITTSTAEKPPVLEPSSLSKSPKNHWKPQINWEQFMGVKLIAWLGGLALFLAAAYSIKYSFENNLVPPAVRMAFGFLVGLGLLVGGVLLRTKQYAVTSQTLCATGVVILYAVTFGCRAIYHFTFFGPIPTFLMMTLITATAFLLAVRLSALVVAVLGMLGGFLTPLLLSTGQDNPLGLFVYIAILDAGLVAVALNRRWNFLTALGALGTAGLEAGWLVKFFDVGRYYAGTSILIPLTVFIGFSLLFLVALAWVKRRQNENPWSIAASLFAIAVTFLAGFYFLTFSQMLARPGWLFAFILGADLCLLTLVILNPKLAIAQLGGGALVFLSLGIWTLTSATPPLLNWALGINFIFALLHTAFPLVLRRLRPNFASVQWGHLFPPLALFLIIPPLLSFSDLSILVWPFILIIDSLAIGLAILTSSLLSIGVVLILTLAVLGLWIFKIPVGSMSVTMPLVMVGGFTIFFFVAALFAARHLLKRLGGLPGTLSSDKITTSPLSAGATAQIPALSAILPFVLLILLTLRMPLSNPSPVFGLALLLTVLLLGLARALVTSWLPAVTLLCVVALEHAWHGTHFAPAQAPIAMAWAIGYFGLFTVFPFLFLARFKDHLAPWVTSALAGPLHFYLLHHAIAEAYPNPIMGLLPAAFALPALGSLAVILKRVPVESKIRLSQLAWFGGVALFFITLIFPIQFDRQWITIAWAMEGAALCWLFHRIPHPGLRLTGVVLLAISFLRLTANPAVLSYHARSATAIFNWYLYSYGLVIISLFAGGRWLAPPRHQFGKINLPPILFSLGSVLAFLLLNIEIADYFTAPGESSLTFRFSGDIAGDMTYTIAWALFALAFVTLGLAKRWRPVRYAGLGLLGVTLVKLFLHDLAQLQQLYRIAALASVAVIAILASFLYQRFVSNEKKSDESISPPPA